MPSPDPFTVAADLLDPQPSPHLHDPVGWVHDRLDEHLWSKQTEIAESVHDHRYTAVHSCHDAGKSYVASRIAAWWIDAHPPGEAFVVSTAPTFAQVRAILWREIGRAHRKGELVGRVNQTEWHIGPEIVAFGRKPADTDPAAFQGIHARYVLVIIDEACGVPETLWAAVDALVTNEDCRVLAIGNPDDPVAHFAKVCRPGSGWNVIHIDGLDTPNLSGEPVPDDLRPLLLSKVWVEERRARWGETSPLWTSKVRGLFPEDATDTVIPLSWVVAAQDRWRAWHDDGAEVRPLDVLGVDVARGGADRTVFAPRHGHVVLDLVRVEGKDSADTMVTASRAGQLLHPGARAVVDVIGIGAGVHDRLVQLGHRSQPFNAGAGTQLVDSTGEFGFANKRAAAWWNLREHLDPARQPTLCLPPDDDLAADLTAPKWKLTTGGRILVEPKDEIRKRLGRSTDDGDAVVQSLWPAEQAGPAVVEYEDHVDISPY